MSRFLGSEICMLDAKGRINVPARMRKNLAPEANDTFVIVRSFDPCVNLYPADEWELFDAARTIAIALSTPTTVAPEKARGAVTRPSPHARSSTFIPRRGLSDESSVDVSHA